MKLAFDDIVLGGGPDYYLDSDSGKSFSGELDNINIKIPRTDYSRNIADYLSVKTRIFKGTIIGTSPEDYRQKKRALANKIRNTYEITVTDDYRNSSGTWTTYATYTFSGKIVDFHVNDTPISTSSRYSIAITSEDPLLYLSPAVSETANVAPRGFSFPLVFPFIFAGPDNIITITNAGLVTSYPTITVDGPCTDLEIVNGQTGEIFTYSGPLPLNSSLVLTPVPTDPIKARLDGVSVIGYTNSLWSALELAPGENTFTFFGNNVTIGTTLVTFEFSQAFVGI